MGAEGSTSRIIRLISRWSMSAFALYAGLFIVLAVHRIPYPGLLTNSEGEAIQFVGRAAHGIPVYPANPEGVVTGSNTPLYYFVAAPLYRLLGDSIAGPRIISVFLSLMSGLIVAAFAWKESRTRWVAALAGSLFFASYRIMDAFLTCALPDALFLTLLLLGFWFLGYGDNWRHDVLWLMYFTLAFWTRQEGAFYFGFAILYSLVFRRNYLAAPLILAAAIAGGPLLYFALGPSLGDGFLDLPWTKSGDWWQLLDESILRTAFLSSCLVPFAMMLSAFYLKRAVNFTDPWRDIRVSPLAWLLISAFLSSSLSVMLAEASNSHFIPLVAALCASSALGARRILNGVRLEGQGIWLAGIALSCAVFTLLANFSGHPAPYTAPVAACLVALAYLLVPRFRRPAAFAGLLILGQFGVAYYNPTRFLP